MNEGAIPGRGAVMILGFCFPKSVFCTSGSSLRRVGSFGLRYRSRSGFCKSSSKKSLFASVTDCISNNWPGSWLSRCLLLRRKPWAKECFLCPDGRAGSVGRGSATKLF